MILLRALGHGALFLAGLLAGLGALAPWLPLPEVPQVREKIAWLRAHRAEYDTLLLGTSRVRRHLIPSLFDHLTAAGGLPLRSFNLGVDSLHSPEDSYVLDLALQLPPPRLRYVFIELSYFRQNFASQGADTIRSAYWHDTPRTRAVLAQLADDLRRVRPLRKRKRDAWRTWSADVATIAGLAATHGRLWCQRGTHLGRGAGFLQALTGLRPAAESLAPLGPGRDGFIPSSLALAGAPLAEYEQQLAALHAQPDRQRPLTPVAQQHLEAMVARVRACGAQPILFIAPTSGGLVFRPTRPVAPLFDFSDPRQWPELYDPRHRADPTHLNTAGAEVFTRLLVRHFLPVAAPAGAPR